MKCENYSVKRVKKNNWHKCVDILHQGVDICVEIFHNAQFWYFNDAVNITQHRCCMYHSNKSGNRMGSSTSNNVII